jgi:putative transposase
MARNRRVIVHNIPYFITCNVQEAAGAAIHVLAPALLDWLNAARSRFGLELHGYVIMPDHWHALMTTHAPHDISGVMGWVKARCTDSVSDVLGTRGPLWQPRFYDRVCRNEVEFGDKLDYMHLNPVRDGLVACPEDWHWCSWYAYVEGGTPPLQVDPVAGSFDARWAEWGRHAPPKRHR